MLHAHNDLTILAGGTDIYPTRTSIAAWGGVDERSYLDISRLSELRGIEDHGDHWWIGALTTWTDIVQAKLPPQFDALKAAARDIGGIQIQNRGTIAGNCCTASPAGDSIACLLALDAEFELASSSPRRVPADQFFVAYRKTALAPAEIVTGIRIPKQRGLSAFRKLGARRYLVISIAMVAGIVDTDDGGHVTSARFVVGACSATAQRLPALESAMIGRPLDPAIARPAHLAHLTPLDDIRASAEYRRAAALQLTRDLIADLAAPATRERAYG
jgi:N-methylhydantoinase B